MTMSIGTLADLTGKPAADPSPISAIAAMQAPGTGKGKYRCGQRERSRDAANRQHCQSRSGPCAPTNEPACGTSIIVDDHVDIIEHYPFPLALRPRHDRPHRPVGQRQRTDHDHISDIDIDARGQFDAIFSINLPAIMDHARFRIARLPNVGHNAPRQQQSDAAEMSQQRGMSFTSGDSPRCMSRRGRDSDIHARLPVPDRCHALQSIPLRRSASTGGQR